MSSRPRSPDDHSRQLRDLVTAGRCQDALDYYHGDGGSAEWPAEAQLAAATAAMRVGDAAAAEELARVALDRFGARADQDGRMRALNLLGAALFEAGRLDDAAERFTGALRLAEQLRDTLFTARTLNNLASLAHLRGAADEALGLYRRALLAYQRIGDRRGAAETYHNLGLTFRELGDLPQAEAATAQAVRHADVTGDGCLLALALSGQGELEIAAGRYEVAERTLARAESLAAEGGDDPCIGEVGRLRALAALRRGAWAEARAEADRALTLAVRCQSALLQAECAALAALAARAMGNAGDAKVLREEALDVFARLSAKHFIDRFDALWAAGEVGLGRAPAPA
jgi:tetratricopeptide (TPR) repeat protein